MEIFGYCFALLIGLLMGLIGGGGSILGVPVFVYLFKMDAISATTISLFVVGATSAFGAFGNARNGNVDFKTALFFGIPSVFSVIFMRKIVLPHLPENLINIGSVHIAKNVFILVMFAVLMLISSTKMILGNKKMEAKTVTPQYLSLSIQGIGVGVITGMIGAGGGFLIIPALVMLLNLDMKKAIGTSLLIISLNSLLGFVSSPKISEIHWEFLLIFTGISVLGMFLGIQLGKKIDSKKLRPIFGWFVLTMGIYMMLREVFFH
jgi:uncharacterized membrane protein YfcA